jgi:hydroxymethylglutaryl-CoA reductase
MTMTDRILTLAGWLGMGSDEAERMLKGGGLTPEVADRLVENVVGLYSMPFAVATNFKINGADTLVPMVIEEPSVVAAASNAARMVREGGGFIVESPGQIMACQVQIFTGDTKGARAAISGSEEMITREAAKADPTLCALGGGPVGLEIHCFPAAGPDKPYVVVHLLVDVLDAMGANTVNTMGEKVAPLLEKITGGKAGLKIVSNLCDRRLVRAVAKVPLRALSTGMMEPSLVRNAIVSASRFAEADPYRAATHNKGIMNGVDAVVMATGNDWRAVEAGAHAYAAAGGTYRPLCTWRTGEDGALEGRLEIPIAVGTVGGATSLHPTARAALGILRAQKAADVASAAAAAGMANNLAALRALATEGIQKGHMRLHMRSRTAAQDDRDITGG